MTETKCPYCLSPMASEMQLLQSLTPRQHRIYEAVVNAGPEGIDTKELMERCIPGKSPTTMRTALHGINSKVAPLIIRTRGGRSYLDRLNWSQTLNDQTDTLDRW